MGSEKGATDGRQGQRARTAGSRWRPLPPFPRPPCPSRASVLLLGPRQCPHSGCPDSTAASHDNPDEARHATCRKRDAHACQGMCVVLSVLSVIGRRGPTAGKMRSNLRSVKKPGSVLVLSVRPGRGGEGIETGRGGPAWPLGGDPGKHAGLDRQGSPVPSVAEGRVRTSCFCCRVITLVRRDWGC